MLPPPLGPVGNEKFVGDGGIKGKRVPRGMREREMEGEARGR